MIKGTFLQRMLWRDRLGDWNPQLLRELQGRLTGVNMAITLFASAAVQWLIFNRFGGIAFQAKELNLSVHSEYCHVPPPVSFSVGEVANCAPHWINHALIAQHHSQSRFLLMGVVMMFVLVVLGVYLLTADVLRERRRGTITFIQASPQRNGTFIWGKVLGVPILLYGAIALAMPLHYWMGRAGGIPGLGIVCFYGVLSLGAMVFFHTALLGAFLFPPRYQVMAFVSAIITAFLLLMANFQTQIAYYEFKHNTIIQLQYWFKLFAPTLILQTLVNSYPKEYLEIPFNYHGWEQVTWFHLSITASTLLTTVWMVIQYAVCLYWVQKGLNRKLTHPHKPPLTPMASCGIVALCQGVWLGFLMGEPWDFFTSFGHGYFHWEALRFWLGFSGGLLALMLLLLMPSRSELCDPPQVVPRGGRFPILAHPRNTMMPMAIAHSLITIGAIALLPAFWNPRLFTFAGVAYPAMFLIIALGCAWVVTVNCCQLCMVWGWWKLWAWGVNMILFTIHGLLIGIVLEHVPFGWVVMAEGAIALLLALLCQQQARRVRHSETLVYELS